MHTHRATAVVHPPARRGGPGGRLLDEVLTDPPPLPAGAVRRPALVERVTEMPDRALVLVTAPPGYGKTTFLSEWSHDEERPVFWLALAERELDVPRLAARRAWNRLPELIGALRQRHEAFVVVVDDAHWIDRASLGSILQATLKELPAGSTIAVAARTEPPLPTSRLLAHQVLARVSASQLAMTAAEASSLLIAEGVVLEPPRLEELVTRTQGWAAALYLAATALRDMPEAGGDPGAEYPVVFDFVREEVLDPLPGELLDFATRTSVLDVLSGPACDAVLDEHSSGRRLDELARLTPLLERLDCSRSLYTWHPLVRDVLRTAHGLEPEDERRRRLRASAYFARCGDIPRAIEHAAAVGDADTAGELLLAHIAEYLFGGHRTMVRGWLDAFPPSVLAAHPALGVAVALTCLVAGDLSAADRWSTAASSVSEPAASRQVVAAASVVNAMTARGGLQDIAAVASPTMKADLDGTDLWPLCLLLSGVALHLGGDRDAADELLDESCRLSSGVTPSLAALCLAQRAMIAMEREDWESAEDLTDRALLFVQEWGLTEEPLVAVAFAAAAVSRAHHGYADRAKQDLRRAAELLSALHDFLPWYGAETRMLMAHASLWLADVVGARTLLAEASRHARKVQGAATFTHWFDEAWAYMDDIAESRLSGPSSLTIAELRILRFLPSHRSFREIADQLGVSANTVKTQAHAVYRKLGAASRSEAVQCALDVGLLGQ